MGFFMMLVHAHMRAIQDSFPYASIRSRASGLELCRDGIIDGAAEHSCGVVKACAG